ncbi:hypothetical protein BpHYR1_034209 [Brachionus plicatilis]|uniref:Uncharacterized protein n=1 Tax=Brachionus plicatilis TaxID=10195 RepID=A0A3M7SM33_BRAPC|nr:hypothetical protein BpHYR1_034209 [Brachionus plicatilis]
MHRFYGIDSRLTLKISDESAATTLHIRITQNGAILDLTVRCKHDPYVVLVKFLHSKLKVKLNKKFIIFNSKQHVKNLQIERLPKKMIYLKQVKDYTI